MPADQGGQPAFPAADAPVPRLAAEAQEPLQAAVQAEIAMIAETRGGEGTTPGGTGYREHFTRFHTLGNSR